MLSAQLSYVPITNYRPTLLPGLDNPYDAHVGIQSDPLALSTDIIFPISEAKRDNALSVGTAKPGAEWNVPSFWKYASTSGSNGLKQPCLVSYYPQQHKAESPNATEVIQKIRQLIYLQGFHSVGRNSPTSPLSGQRECESVKLSLDLNTGQVKHVTSNEWSIAQDANQSSNNRHLIYLSFSVKYDESKASLDLDSHRALFRLGQSLANSRQKTLVHALIRTVQELTIDVSQSRRTTGAVYQPSKESRKKVLDHNKKALTKLIESLEMTVDYGGLAAKIFNYDFIYDIFAELDSNGYIIGAEVSHGSFQSPRGTTYTSGMTKHNAVVFLQANAMGTILNWKMDKKWTDAQAVAINDLVDDCEEMRTLWHAHSPYAIKLLNRDPKIDLYYRVIKCLPRNANQSRSLCIVNNPHRAGHKILVSPDSAKDYPHVYGRFDVHMVQENGAPKFEFKLSGILKEDPEFLELLNWVTDNGHTTQRQGFKMPPWYS